MQQRLTGLLTLRPKFLVMQMLQRKAVDLVLPEREPRVETWARSLMYPIPQNHQPNLQGGCSVPHFMEEEMEEVREVKPSAKSHAARKLTRKLGGIQS